MKDQTVLISGGAGAVGCNLARYLAESGNRVLVLDNLSSGYKQNLDGITNVEFFFGSVTDTAILDHIFEQGVDSVFHLAAHFANQNSLDHPREDLHSNGLGTFNVLEGAREAGVKKILNVSTSCIQGDFLEPVNDGHVGRLDTPYAIHKLLGEYYTQFFFEHYGLNCRTVRLFNCYGPGERPGKYRNVIPNFFAIAMAGKPLPLTGTGEETRSFTYVSDIVRGLVDIIQSDETRGLVLNLGTDVETKIIDLAKKINAVTGNAAGVEFLSRRKWDRTMRRVANIELVKKLVNYRLSVDLDVGLNQTYAWLKNLEETPVVQIER